MGSFEVGGREGGCWAPRCRRGDGGKGPGPPLLPGLGRVGLRGGPGRPCPRPVTLRSQMCQGVLRGVPTGFVARSPSCLRGHLAFPGASAAHVSGARKKWGRGVLLGGGGAHSGGSRLLAGRWDVAVGQGAWQGVLVPLVPRGFVRGAPLAQFLLASALRLWGFFWLFFFLISVSSCCHRRGTGSAARWGGRWRACMAQPCRGRAMQCHRPASPPSPPSQPHSFQRW